MIHTKIDYDTEMTSNNMSIVTNKKVSKIINEIMKIIMPHRYMVGYGIYGENDIEHMIANDKNIIGNWPEPQLCAISQDSVASQTINYYQSLFKKMIKQYITHATSVGDMLSYKDVVTNNDIIDLTKVFEHDNSNISYPNIQFYESEIDTLRSYGWVSFIPCLNNFVIKTNKKHYFHINVTHFDKTTKTLQVKIHDYMGDRYEWICNAFAHLEITFTDETSDGLPCSWKYISSQSYEELLIKHTSDMNWSNKELQFWYDVFGVSNIKEQTLIEITIPYDETTYHKHKTVLKKTSDITRLKKLSPNDFDISILATGEDTAEFFKQKTAEKLFLNYIKMMSVINYLLYTSTNVINKNDITDDINNHTRNIIISESSTKDTIIRQMAKMIIKSKTEPIIY